MAFNCAVYGITLDSKRKLNNHSESQHPTSEETSSSSEPSAPRKKQEKLKINVSNDEEVVDIMDLDQVEEKKEEVIELADTNIMDLKNNEEDIQEKK